MESGSNRYLFIHKNNEAMAKKMVETNLTIDRGQFGGISCDTRTVPPPPPPRSIFNRTFTIHLCVHAHLLPGWWLPYNRSIRGRNCIADTPANLSLSDQVGQKLKVSWLCFRIKVIVHFWILPDSHWIFTIEIFAQISRHNYSRKSPLRSDWG